jgi:tRNA-Thr(GGU) m(6)t(6)A37 methyltransferase TsaA
VIAGYGIRPIGRVCSPLREIALAPVQGDEGAPDASVVLAPEFAPGLEGIAAGDAVVLLTWLHHARTDVLRVHPRGDVTRPARGVFATRSPDRPNPIGLHEVTVARVEGNMLCVRGLEAVDGTPVLDVKPVLGPVAGR